MKRKSIPVTPPRETPEQFEARLEVESYQFRFNELLILTFKNAVQLIEAVAVLDPPHLRREFSNAFEAYEQGVDMLTQGRSAIHIQVTKMPATAHRINVEDWHLESAYEDRVCGMEGA